MNNERKEIGNTPLVPLSKIEAWLSLKAQLFAKLEGENPFGSAKDRVAKYMLDDAEKRGYIKDGAAIIEATSGNTGIGLAGICRERGYRAIIVMPSTMSKERIELMESYGAEVVLTDGALGMQGSIDKAKELNLTIEGSFIPSQFENMANPQAHYETTGPEIYRDMKGDVDVFVSAIGTGGTISGVGKYLKEQNPKIKIIGVEPSASPVLSGGVAGAHKIQGIGAGFIPKTLNTAVYDEIVTVSDDEAYTYTKELYKREGIGAGISSGAALCAAITLANREENRDKKIVVLLPDTKERYLSLGLF